MKTLQEVMDVLLEDEEFREAYEEMLPEESIANAILTYRVKNSITQQEFAEACGINRSDLSKLESAEANPTLATLKKIAKGLNLQLSIGFNEKEHYVVKNKSYMAFQTKLKNGLMRSFPYNKSDRRNDSYRQLGKYYSTSQCSNQNSSSYSSKATA